MEQSAVTAVVGDGGWTGDPPTAPPAYTGDPPPTDERAVIGDPPTVVLTRGGTPVLTRVPPAEPPAGPRVPASPHGGRGAVRVEIDDPAGDWVSDLREYHDKEAEAEEARRLLEDAESAVEAQMEKLRAKGVRVIRLLPGDAGEPGTDLSARKGRKPGRKPGRKSGRSRRE